MSDQPNILMICADQLAARALPAYGCDWIETPNIDRIVSRGVRFDGCHTACPLCQPTRASYWTGLWPHTVDVRSNGRNDPVEPVPDDVPTLGEAFTAAGYRTDHYGKCHDACSLRGFGLVAPVEQIEMPAPDAYMYNYDTLQDEDTARKVVARLGEPDTGPWLCVADFNNPHNICGWIGDHAGPHENDRVEGELPPLPFNFRDENFADRPLPVQYICCSHNRLSQTEGWTDENYRAYRDAYRHYVGLLDACVGRVLDAFEARGDADRTLVMFYADHGDGIGAHRMVTKQVSFIDETTRVPLVLAGPGVREGAAVPDALVSSLDYLPTLCDAAGIAPQPDLWGRSLMPWAREERDDSPHAYVASEWHTEWGFTKSPGRMIRTPRWKYTRYLEGDGEELYDLEADPGETRTLAPDPEYAAVLEEHRALLDRHVAETEDDFFSLEWFADPRWRSHDPGYEHHTGPAAPMVG